jgi:hypothetical protein
VVGWLDGEFGSLCRALVLYVERIKPLGMLLCSCERENVIVVTFQKLHIRKSNVVIRYRGGAVCERGIEPPSPRQSEQPSASHERSGFYVVSN